MLTGWIIRWHEKSFPVICDHCHGLRDGSIYHLGDHRFCCRACMHDWYDQRKEDYNA